MNNASDYRAMARQSMAGKMKACVLACLILLAVTLVLQSILNFVPGGGPQYEIVTRPDGSFQFRTVGGSQYDVFPQPDGSFRIRVNHQSLLISELAARYPWLALVYLALLGITPALEVGLFRFFLNLVDGQPAEPRQVFSGFSVFWRAMWLYVQIFFRVFLWTLLFIVPGIIAAYRYSQAPYLLADHPDMTASQAIAESGRLMQGRKWRLFCLQISFIGWNLLSALTLGILHIFYVGPYMQAAFACFHRDLTVGAFTSDPIE